MKYVCMWWKERKKAFGPAAAFCCCGRDTLRRLYLLGCFERKIDEAIIVKTISQVRMCLYRLEGIQREWSCPITTLLGMGTTLRLQPSRF